MSVSIYTYIYINIYVYLYLVDFNKDCQEYASVCVRVCKWSYVYTYVCIYVQPVLPISLIPTLTPRYILMCM